ARTRRAPANPKVRERAAAPPGLLGTGTRSARVAAAVSAASPISSRPLWLSVANWYPAATSTPRPATQTGVMRAASLRGGAAVEVTPAPLPGELVDRVPSQLTEHDRNERDHREEDDQPGFPLQHPQPPRRDARRRDFLAWRVPRDPP